MEWDQGLRKEFRKTSVLAMIMLGALPVVLLIIAFNLQPEGRVGGETDMMFYILLMVAITAPATALLIEHFHINKFRTGTASRMNPGQLLCSISLIKFTFAEATYIYGFITFLLSGDMARMLCFYPIGIAWSVIYWPRRSGWEKQIERIEAP